MYQILTNDHSKISKIFFNIFLLWSFITKILVFQYLQLYGFQIYLSRVEVSYTKVYGTSTKVQFIEQING